MDTNKNKILIASHLGLFLPEKVKNKLIQFVSILSDHINSLTSDKFNSNDLELVFSQDDNIQVKMNTGGKDALLLMRLSHTDHHFMVKLYDMSFEELIYHTLSVQEYKDQLNQGFISKLNIEILVEPLEILAIGLIWNKTHTFTVMFQEFNEDLSFTKYLSTKPEYSSILREILKYVSKKGFILDYVSKNFNVSYNKNQTRLYLKYLDLISFHNPFTYNKAKMVTTNLLKGNAEPSLFEFITD